jgi:hypothetical protein
MFAALKISAIVALCASFVVAAPALEKRGGYW